MIADFYLSRQHARLFKEGNEWFVEDLGSRNGTLLNGRRVEKATRVEAGDDVQLCGSVISLVPSETRSRDDARMYESESELSTIEVRDLLDPLLAYIFEHLQPEEGTIYLRRAGEFYRAAYRTVSGQEPNYALSARLMREIAEKGTAVLVPESEADERSLNASTILSSGTQSLLVVPVLAPEGTLGMIALSWRRHLDRIDEADLVWLQSVAEIVAMRFRSVLTPESE